MGQYRYWVVFIGFMVNYLLVIGVNRLAGVNSGGVRTFLAALIGGIYIFFCTMVRFRFLGDIHWRMILLLVISSVAFGFERRMLICWVLYICLQLTIDSLSGGGFWPVLLLGCVLFMLCRIKRPGNGNLATVTITFNGKRMDIIALLDTGNTLKDPVSGLDVIVVDSDIAREMLDIDQQALLRPVELLQRHHVPGLRLIPYSSVGQPSGLLLGMRVDELKIKGQKADKIIAFAPHKIGQGKGYQALAGGRV